VLLSWSFPFQVLFQSLRDTVAKFYKSSTTHFTCISNPSYQIPISHINDDYCDCPDGSDEPGTSACSHLSPLSPYSPSIDLSLNTSLALPGFYCKNKGHIPSYIPFTNVNDGKCDYTLCCDGSDEWASVGGISCPDKCKEIGKEWRSQDEARRKAHGAAMKRRKELATEASRLKLEVEDRIKTLEAEREALEVKVKDAEKVVQETEKSDKLKVVKGPGKTGRTGVLASLAKTRIEELRTNLVTVRGQRDAMLGRVVELENTLGRLKEEYNPNFNDEGVKTAVRAWEEYAARDTNDGWEDAQDRDLDEISKPDGEGDSGINWSEWETSEEAPETDVDVLYNFSAYLPPTLRLWLEERLSSLRQILVDNGILAPTSDSSTASVIESTALKAARKTLSETQSSLSNAQRELENHKSDLAKDYGPDSIFRALKSTCIQKDSGEYTYELCFLGSTKQKPKRGGADQNMGNFVSFGTEMVDEEISADGKGLGKGERITMRYENGGHCWNGPARSTLAVLGCAEKEEIWKITESEKCVYRMEVGTAAVCRLQDGARSEPPKKEGKDEL
jgi:protein kinase C substrate 80K-H